MPNAHFLPLDSRNHILLEEEPAWQQFLDGVRNFLGKPVSEASTHKFQAFFSELTPREQQVLELIAQGLSNAEIAESLVISPKTVRNHVTHIYSKLAVDNRAKAIVVARKAGFGANGLSEGVPSTDSDVLSE